MTLLRAAFEYCFRVQDQCCAHYRERLSADSEAERHVDGDEEMMALPAQMEERKDKGHSS